MTHTHAVWKDGCLWRSAGSDENGEWIIEAQPEDWQSGPKLDIYHYQLGQHRGMTLTREQAAALRCTLEVWLGQVGGAS